MVANLMRHNPRAPDVATELYERIKLLICTNSEPDPAQTLKVLCLLTLWNCRPSTPVSVDGPWHWLGVGLRLAVQMGLHRESTYLDRPNASCLRRIFWFLQNSESLHVSCWGYPPHLRPPDFDVKLPTLDDFDIRIFEGLWFIESTKLCTITNRVSELRAERRPIRAEEHAEFKTALFDWTSELPVELQLYDSNGSRNAYRRPVSELAIQYFVAIILSEFLKYRENPKSCQGVITSLLAGSCGATLYDEIYCRDESVFLPQIHGFFCLALALPLVYYNPQSATRVAARKRDLEVLHSVLTTISDRYGDGKMFLRMIDRLQMNVARTALPSELCDSVSEPEALLEAHRLFPFPRTFCDNMDLLEPSAGVDDLFSVNEFAPMFDDAIFDLTWLDAIGIALGDESMDISGDI
ncbi:putative acetamidase regulatory protein [Polyplosphaeria fusca]|uniref:Acetamidase regulatory protein n=1 Tax=Polyplosphaeria fusca TaxID=682080 RepID=A0A9P4QIE8_9PLEO|nr:putative acetamidase regulatory protein [Polyplosphaeria fusca]